MYLNALFVILKISKSFIRLKKFSCLWQNLPIKMFAFVIVKNAAQEFDWIRTLEKK